MLQSNGKGLPAAEKLLWVRNLEAEQENRVLFSNLTFCLSPGMYLELKGPNGVGKSTLLKILVGLKPANFGSIFWARRKQPLNFPDYDYYRDVIYLGHKNGIQDQLTVLENLSYWLNLRSREKKQDKEQDRKQLNAVLEYWELKDYQNSSCDKLSAGQKQRLALARLSVWPVKLWLLDEPCNALDKKAIILFEQQLKNHLAANGAAIIVSHLPLNVAGALSLELGN